MASTLLVKRSSVSGKTPAAADLSLGELAINTADGLLYAKKGNGTVTCINPPLGPAPLSTVFEFTVPLPAATFLVNVPTAQVGMSVLCSLDGTTTGSSFADEYEMEPMIVAGMIFTNGYIAFSLACCDSNMLTVGKKQINYYVG